jgi:Protein of unknown function (DUF4231)
MTPQAQEGPITAAQDFAEARFNINEKNRHIEDIEMSRKIVKATIVAVILSTAFLVIALYALRVPRNSPLRLPQEGLGFIDLGVVVCIAAALTVGIRSLSRKRKEIGDLRLQISQLREAERDARTRISSGGTTRLLWSYHSDVLITIEEYRNKARQYRRIHNRFQTVIIIGSILTTAISTAAAKYSALEWVAVVVSFSVGISAGMTGYFKFRERSMNLQQAADDLEQEYKAVELGIRTYRKLGDEDRLVEFAERAEGIKDQQRKREQQLEQPPEGRSGAAMTAPGQA